jgi:hypothetical protein
VARCLEAEPSRYKAHSRTRRAERAWATPGDPAGHEPERVTICPFLPSSYRPSARSGSASASPGSPWRCSCPASPRPTSSGSPSPGQKIGRKL